VDKAHLLLSLQSVRALPHTPRAPGTALATVRIRTCVTRRRESNGRRAIYPRKSGEGGISQDSVEYPFLGSQVYNVKDLLATMPDTH